MSHYKPYPEYKDSGVEWIGEVPAHWGVVPGKALFIEKKRKNTDLSGGDYLSLVAGRGVIPYEEKGDIGNRKPDDLDRCKLVEPGDHVINSMNFSIGAYGKSRFSGVCSPVYVILGENDRRLGEGFGELILSNPSYQDFIQSFGSGILDHRRSIGWDEIKVAHVPCPPVQEQEEISALVHRETTRIDTLVEKKQRFIELLEEKRQAAITQAVTKGLDPNVPMKDSGIKAVGQVPSHWFAAPLRSMMHRKKSLVGNAWENFKLLSLTKNGVIERDVTENFGKFPESFDTYQVVAPDDMVMCLFDIDETPRTVGLSQTHGMITGAYTVFGIDSPVHRDYLYQLFLHLDNVKGLKPYYSGLRKTIRPPKLLSMRIPIPTEEEARKISHHIRSTELRFDRLVAKTQRSIELLKERRAALITAAVTGKIDVREEAAA